ncbi:MAG: 50S ribosomal protein L11 methyltransferase [Gammaproteobacteria bacterium]|nr:50S ribosomal protein L11 methyltransferase [Gammaproteobacteria bacterium]
MADTWLQAALDCPQAAVPAAEEIFEGLGALVTWTQGADDEEILEPEPGATPLWRAVRLTALLPPDTDRQRIAAAFPGSAVRFETVADRDWDAEWRKTLKPLRFGRRLWVCPVGQDCPDPAGISLRLEPGLAFGTGTHPTTAMCLAWLDGQELRGARLLDYGCGSGVLAIAALVLGARAAVAVDIDPQALIATRDNASRNGCTDLLTSGLPADVLPASRTERFDVLVANILSGPLVRLAPGLRRFAGPATGVALSGILADQAAEVMAAFSPWVTLAVADQQGGWVLLAGRVAGPVAP